MLLLTLDARQRALWIVETSDLQGNVNGLALREARKAVSFAHRGSRSVHELGLKRRGCLVALCVHRQPQPARPRISTARSEPRLAACGIATARSNQPRLLTSEKFRPDNPS